MATLKHPLFTLIKEEHAQIEKIASELTNHIEVRPLLLKKMQQHHWNEEILLFPKLNAHPQICMGGPMCSYFFDDQITSPPMASAESIAQSPIQLPDQLASLWSSHSPLRIPTGEHLALQHLLMNCAPDIFVKHLSSFMKIMNSNFRKEEECLFHVCCQLLNEDDLDSISASWIK